MRAIVTGAARGIGRAIALRLARDAQNTGGAQLVLADLHKAELTELVADIQALGGRAIAAAGDLADAEFAQQLAQTAQSFGGLDALVSNAGLGLFGPLLTYSLGDWERNFSVHVRAPWLLAQACHSALKQSQGAIVITASISGEHPTPPGGAYSASKAAALMLARHLAVEWGPNGIRVNTVSPGMTLTSLTHAAYTAPGVLEAREARIPLRRIGQPDDIANAVAYLLSSESAYVTGADLVVDGGLVNTLMANNPGWNPRPSTN